MLSDLVLLSLSADWLNGDIVLRDLSIYAISKSRDAILYRVAHLCFVFFIVLQD